MAVQIGARPDSGFDDPIGMLKDCHRRIERFLEILFAVARRAKGRALNSDEQGAVQAALRYFGESGPSHNKDEEESLFPRLRNMEAAPVLEKVLRLETEHREGNLLHDEIAQLYSKWIAAGSLNASEDSRLHAITEELSRLYREHIHIEEDIVFPLATKLLDQDALAAMGSEFRIRRE